MSIIRKIYDGHSMLEYDRELNFQRKKKSEKNTLIDATRDNTSCKKKDSSRSSLNIN